jgi:5'-nucleotidase
VSVQVILDVDGPCTDFHEKARCHIKEELGHEFPLSHFKEWDFTAVLSSQAERDHMNAVVARPGFATSMIPNPEAIVAVATMRERGARILFATAPHLLSKTWKDEREAWLVEHFGADPLDVAHIHQKDFLGGDVFVDDKPSHVRSWRKRNPLASGRLWRTFYNEMETGLDFVSSWSEVVSLVSSLSRIL